VKEKKKVRKRRKSKEGVRKIKVVLEHLAASDGVCSRHRSGHNVTIKNRLFSFVDTLLFLPHFLDFQCIFG
jgi:hypothetical protein